MWNTAQRSRAEFFLTCTIDKTTLNTCSFQDYREGRREGGGQFTLSMRVVETSILQNVYVKHRHWHTLQKAWDKQDSCHTAEPILTVGVTTFRRVKSCLPLAQPRSYRTTPCQPSAIDYSIHSQLPSAWEVEGSCEHGNEPSGSIKCRGSSCLAEEDLLVSQESASRS
jgi:hypothetical protein